ncbi:hypothetical protein [Methylobacterium sp. E-046]|uniref:hypothetical protein n=1 Tax=Methylobacterium sp. E-046 TaxID=2836576 RepID=UPI001FB91904|nr:hypothetical protein [Methylobacterium sp. E-046]MCJ2098461.1 hypothetical protein [Methylobacterium sp. E-046]
MAPALPRGTRIGRPCADGSLIPGTILGPAFGEGFYCTELRGEGGPEIVCVHVGEILVDPVFADLRTAAVALRDLDQRAAPVVRELRAAGGAF